MEFPKIDPAKQALSLVDEFKAFAFKGNVIDLAVGVIVGAAFANIIKSLVDNILMPAIAVIAPGNKGYESWTLVLNGSTIHYGKFLADGLNFLLVTLALFLFVVKFLGWIARFHREKSAEIPPLTKDQALLTEIRDLLKSRNAASGPVEPA